MASYLRYIIVQTSRADFAAVWNKDRKHTQLQSTTLKLYLISDIFLVLDSIYKVTLKRFWTKSSIEHLVGRQRGNTEYSSFAGSPKGEWEGQKKRCVKLTN